jgi:hypothetical protein
VVLGATPAEDGRPCAVASNEDCNPQTDTFYTFNVTIIGEGAVDICGFDLTFTSSGSQIFGPFNLAVLSNIVARPNANYAFSSWGGILSGSINPTTYPFIPVECQNTPYNITATFESI